MRERQSSVSERIQMIRVPLAPVSSNRRGRSSGAGLGIASDPIRAGALAATIAGLAVAADSGSPEAHCGAPDSRAAAKARSPPHRRVLSLLTSAPTRARDADA